MAAKSMSKTTTDNDAESIVKFNNTDEIECVSITPGELFIDGERSKELYVFADADDVQYIRYDDLMFMVRSKKPCVFKPRFIIQNEDFLEQNPTIKELYGNLYSTSDLKAILKLPANQMGEKIKALPPGAQESIKLLAMTDIDRGVFDSIQRIKVLDEIFQTNMLIKSVGLD